LILAPIEFFSAGITTKQPPKDRPNQKPLSIRSLTRPFLIATTSHVPAEEKQEINLQKEFVPKVNKDDSDQGAMNKIETPSTAKADIAVLSRPQTGTR
jgi:hypothetical protein